jgi:HNH endonuclease
MKRPINSTPKRASTYLARQQMLAKEATVSANLARSLFTYDEHSGSLIRKVRRARWQPGTIAGHRCKTEGYIRLSISGKLFYAHRVIFFMHHGRWPVGECDHKDRNGFNNRIENLRECTKQVNLENREFKLGSCGFRGVTRDGKKFRAQLHHDGTLVRVGGFNDAAEAYVAYGVLRDLLALAA